MSYSRRMAKRQIHLSKQKYKHQVDAGALAVNMSAATTTNVIIAGVDNPVLASTTNVQAKAMVTGFYFELHVKSTYGADVLQVFDWCFQASPQSAIGAIDPTTVGANAGKAYVFKSGQLPVAPGAYTASVRGFIRIPRKYSRFMNTDVIYFNIRSRNATAATDNYQLKVIYKEVRG